MNCKIEWLNHEGHKGTRRKITEENLEKIQPQSRRERKVFRNVLQKEFDSFAHLATFAVKRFLVLANCQLLFANC
jgi:hypothetical protein